MDFQAIVKAIAFVKYWFVFMYQDDVQRASKFVSIASSTVARRNNRSNNIRGDAQILLFPK